MANYEFFQNKACEYFPCHKCADPDNFNCLFCYCPLYALGDACGGNFTYTPDGIKDCSGCLRPHKRENYPVITAQVEQVIAMAKHNRKPVKLIIDTDIGFDCDDAGALALVHRLCDGNEAELLATTACYDSPYVAGCTDAINRFYNRPVPVGNLYFPKNDGYEHPVYSPALCSEYPNSYPSDGSNAPEDAIALIRRILANSEDDSITFVITGALSTAAQLLCSAPDSFSPLTGKELIAKKIHRTVVMGGRFYEGWPEDVVLDDNFVVTWEWNIKGDVPAAQDVCKGWPGELVFSSFEVGLPCISMGTFCASVPEHHPVRRAYALRGFLEGRSSWDQTAVLEAIRPGVYFKTSAPGQVRVNDDGVTSFTPDNQGKQYYLIPILDSKEIANLIDNLLLSQ